MSDEPLCVFVEALNDDGVEATGFGVGPTTDDAVNAAIEEIRERTGDDSYVMNDWRPG